MESRERAAQFDAAIAPHLGRAYNLARLLVGNAADAEDLVQEASLRAFRALDGFRGGDSKAWLLVIVRNVCYTFLASKKRVVSQVEFQEEQHSEAASVATPEASVLQRSDAASVRRAIENLLPEFREALVLREIEGMSYKQIAEITGTPIGTVMSRLARARGQLRQRLHQQAGRGA
jgi:RNA polymerase sigma factor (sigma-70 family)